MDGTGRLSAAHSEVWRPIRGDQTLAHCPSHYAHLSAHKGCVIDSRRRTLRISAVCGDYTTLYALHTLAALRFASRVALAVDEAFSTLLTTHLPLTSHFSPHIAHHRPPFCTARAVIMYVLTTPDVLLPATSYSQPLSPSTFDMHFPFPPPPPTASYPCDMSSMYGSTVMHLPASSDFDFSFPAPPTADEFAVADVDTPYCFQPQPQSAASTQSTAASAHSMPPADLISAFPSLLSSNSTSPSTSSRRLRGHVDTSAPVSTVAALHLPPPSAATPPYSAHHDRRSSAAVGTHTIDNQRAHTSWQSYTGLTASSGPRAVRINSSLSYPAFIPKVKEEPQVDSRSLHSSLLLGEANMLPLLDLPDLRVNVDMANEFGSYCHTPCTTSPDASHSPISLPSFTVSSISSTPSTPVLADVEAMVNAIDFEFATTDKLMRPIRHRKRRRKVSEINPLEVWRCPNAPCEKNYKRTSSVSINRHKEVCEHRLGAAGKTGVGAGADQSATKSVGSEVLQLIQKLLSGKAANDQQPLNQPMNMTTNDVSLEQLLTGALSEHILRSLTAQLTTPALAASPAKPAAPFVTPTKPAAGRKRVFNSATSMSELPSLMRASTTPNTQPSARPTHKRLMVAAPSESLVADTVRALAYSPSTPSPTGAMAFHSLTLRSPVSAPPASHLPRSTHHARSHSVSQGHQYPQHVRGSFVDNGGLLTGPIGTVGNDLAKARAASGSSDEKVDAVSALSLKVTSVAQAQRELVASLFGHQYSLTTSY